jgi:threonine/homoserine/homoserine lactone efflux protein
MKPYYEWAIPSAAYLIWIFLISIVVPRLMRYLKEKAEQTRHSFDEILVSASGVAFILFLIGLGFTVFIDSIPPLPKKWVRYSDAFLILLFVLAGYFFLDRLMIEILRRYSKKIELMETSAGVVKIFYRVIKKSCGKFVFHLIVHISSVIINPS